MIQQPLRSAYGPQTHPQGEARKQQQMHSEFQLPFFATQSHSDILRIQDDVSVSRSPGYALRVGYSLQVKTSCQAGWIAWTSVVSQRACTHTSAQGSS
ncbi:hypothetical protein CC2G_014716 [Coprinopsis cinerea AmutBmut pab1-1]|nr:hypothetical protein CC2G_014716 [Coprinopsis cinerea AmutBmut pab1-1]